MGEVRIGCSGWNYAHWRDGVFYPPRCPARLWLDYYARHFDTVEVNATFYRLPRERSVAGWVAGTPPGFLFAVKASRYLTHVKRLTDLGTGIERFYERIAPLVASPKLGPVLWQLPATFRRDDERLAAALAALPPGRHCFEFRHESWFADGVYALLRAHGAALVVGDDPRRPFQTLERTADWMFLRFHGGADEGTGDYSERELGRWAGRIAGWSERGDVLAYFNNDWEGYAIRNAQRLQELLGVPPSPGAGVRRSSVR
ncbi:MAG TPA: DUF72 domain-containing protein [Gaiellaceae bacterium]|nr:DUF72 domain-containing protein [Gaiellaceae bacterium]